MTLLTEDPLPTPDVEAMVRAANPDWTVRRAEACDSRTDACAVDVAAPDGARELTLETCPTPDPAAFRPTPHLLRALARRTSIPVPTVVAAVDAHDALPTPFVFVERPDGDDVTGRAETLARPIRCRVAFEAGRHLAELHELGSFDRFGDLRLARDVAHDGGGIDGEGYRVTVADDASESWADRFVARVAADLDRVDERFADLAPAVRATVEENRDALEGPVVPVPNHPGYGYSALRVDAWTGETHAVLGFQGAFTADAAFDLVRAADRLSARAPLGSGRRDRVLAALHDGYAETGVVDWGRAPARRQRLYRLASRLPALAEFGERYGDAPADEREAAVERHRAFVASLVE